jgi:putative ABC transport system permease protein
MEAFVHDVRYAARALRRSPGFAVVVVLTLGIAIGVNTAVFTVANAVLFKGFRHVQRNDRILYIGTQNKGRGCCASFPDFVDWRAQARSFTGLAAVADLQIVVSDGTSAAEHYDATQISPDAFRLLGQRPIVGRDFLDADAEPGAAPVAILRYNFWERHYRKDPAVVGRTLRINGTPTTVVGVMPEDFFFPQNEDIWLPLVPTADLQKRESRSLWFAFGRLADGATIDTARAELETIGRRLAIAYPRTNEGWTPQPRTFAEFFVGRDARVIYGTLWGAVGFVVLIACANVANLVLSRGLDRTRERSMLAALGASRWDIVRQPLAESMILSALGGACGWWIARLCVGAYELTANPPGRSWSAHLFDYRMDRQVMGYVLLVSIATTVLFGLVPSLYLSRLDANAALQDGGRTVAGGRRGRRLSTALVTIEIAIAVLLLAGAGVMVKSFMNMATASLGVRTADVSAMLVSLHRGYDDAESQIRFFDRLTTRLAEAGSIESVALADELPAATGRRLAYETAGDVPVDAERRSVVSAFTISPGYFGTLGATIAAGRDFNRFDTRSGSPVAIVNQKFADLHWRGEDPRGKRLRLFDGATPGPWMTVVGVASNIVQNMTDRQVQDAVVYRSYLQRPARSLWVVARARPGAAIGAGVFRKEIDALDPDVPIWIGPFPLDTLMTAMGNYWLLGSNAVMFAVFGAIALLLASLGIYAVIAYSVGRRTKEIGIRIAIGATSRDILRLIVAQSAWPLAVGWGVGIIASLVMMPALKSQLVHVSPGDPMTLAGASCLLVACGLGGCLLPAVRATRIGPAVALRHD